MGIGVPKFDLTGQRFGKWTVLEYLGSAKWLCACDCGSTGTPTVSCLRKGKSTCCKKCSAPGSRRRIDISERVFGDWEAISYDSVGSRWLCRCIKCGRTKKARGTVVRKAYRCRQCMKRVNTCVRCGKSFESKQVRRYCSRLCRNSRTLCNVCGKRHQSGDVCRECYKQMAAGDSIDLKGMCFGRWTVKDYAGSGLWKCVCQCGKSRLKATKELRAMRKDASCKNCCLKERNKPIDIAGSQFGRWYVLGYDGKGKWKCVCECGRTGSITGHRLRSGKSTQCQSCGAKNNDYNRSRRGKGKHPSVSIPGHRLARSTGAVVQARLVADQMLQLTGSRLPEKAKVFHLDGNTRNNDPANLKIRVDGDVAITVCGYCKKLFFRKPHTKTRFCSRGCAYKGRQSAIQGDELIVIDIRIMHAVGIPRSKLKDAYSRKVDQIIQGATRRFLVGIESPIYRKGENVQNYIMEAVAFRSRVIDRIERRQRMEDSTAS